MAYQYSSTYNKEHMAKAVGRSLPISRKASIEICNIIRKKTVSRAKNILKDTISLKKAVPFTRFTNGAGHKPGIGPGKYPVNAAKEILNLIEAVETNAQFKGLNTSDLIISCISAHNAGNTWRYGRHRRRKMKRTHIEVVVKEGKKIDGLPNKTQVSRPKSASKEVPKKSLEKKEPAKKDSVPEKKPEVKGDIKTQEKSKQPIKKELKTEVKSTTQETGKEIKKKTTQNQIPAQPKKVAPIQEKSGEGKK